MDDGWYGKRELSLIFGVTVSYLDRDVKPLIAEDHQRKVKRRVYWFAPAVHQAILSRRLNARSVRKPDDGREDLLLAKQKAELARLKAQATKLRLEIQQKRDQLVDRREAQLTLAALRDRLRSFGKTLRKQKASKKLTQLWNDFLTELKDDIEAGNL